jgi:hypothetical protein
MSLTAEFSTIDWALRKVAVESAITPLQARVLLAIADGADDDDGIVSDVLERSLGIHDSAVRRALGVLYSRRLAQAVGCDGGPRRPGTRSRISVTPEGAGACDRVGRWAQAIRQASAAEVPA